MLNRNRGGRARLVLALCAAALPFASVARAQDAAHPDEKIDEARAKRALKSADKIEKEVSKLRQLKYQVPVRKGVESEVALKRHLIEETNKPENVAETAKGEKVARAFGLIPKTFNLGKEEADLLGDQIAGFYDSEGKKLRLVEKKAGFMGMDQAQMEQMDELTMAHELEHALQDQTFDLGRWFAINDGHADRTEAWKCVVEGEATYVSFVWMFDKQQPGMQMPDLKMLFDMNKSMAESMPAAKAQQEKMEKLPIWLVQNLTMPYEDGAMFVQKVYDQGGWDAIGKLFRDPPSSTQQVLHPKKYFDRVEPAEINMPAMRKFAPGSKELDRSTWGEFNVRLLLETLGVKAKAAKKVAAGWHGDHYQALELEDGSTAIVWLSIWESGEKAKAFVDAYLPGLTTLHGEDAGKFSLEQKGDAVLLVDCADAKLREKLANKAWSSAVQDGHVKPLAGFFVPPPARDFTEADENAGFGGGATIGKPSLGERALDEATGYAARFPRGWEKSAETSKSMAGFSKGLWKQGDLELRVLDFPLPFDKEGLPEQIEALAKKNGATSLPKRGKVASLVVGGHDAISVELTDLPGENDAKLAGKLVAVERDGVTLAFVVTAPAAKVAKAAVALDAVLGTVEFVPAGKKTEASVGTQGATFKHPQSAKATVGGDGSGLGDAQCSLESGGTIRLVVTSGATQDLDEEIRESERGRVKMLKGYHALGTTTIERAGLGRAIVTDFEFENEKGMRRARELVTVSGSRRIALTCASAADAWEKNRTAFERALATLSIENVPEEKPAKPAKKKPEPKKDDANEPF